jgi:hypothetical protein
MSRDSDPQAAARAIFGPMDGARVEGGCDHCAAYQVPSQVSQGVWMLTVHHESTCPEWLRHQGDR